MACLAASEAVWLYAFSETLLAFESKFERQMNQRMACLAFLNNSLKKRRKSADCTTKGLAPK